MIKKRSPTKTKRSPSLKTNYIASYIPSINFFTLWFNIRSAERVIGSQLPSFVQHNLPSCDGDQSIVSTWRAVMPYCQAVKYITNTHLPIMGFHATSIKIANRIKKSGFNINSLFTHTDLTQSVQVGQRHGNKYIILCCLFNVDNVTTWNVANKEYRPTGMEPLESYDILLKNIKKYKLESVYQSNQYSFLIAKKHSVVIVGYIMCNKSENTYHLYMY